VEFVNHDVSTASQYEHDLFWTPLTKILRVKQVLLVIVFWNRRVTAVLEPQLDTAPGALQSELRLMRKETWPSLHRNEVGPV
jgi:hypothetical protein